jgi:hypothetical protein
MKLTLHTSLKLILIVSLLTVTTSAVSAPAALPNPVLNFVGSRPIEVGGKTQIRYSFEVENRDAYPADFFAAAPSLPPCGTNTNASRTWVEVYNQSGKRLHGFCAFSKPSDLKSIFFQLGPDEVPPSWIYIELNDRQTNTKYKSNLADTTL